MRKWRKEETPRRFSDSSGSVTDSENAFTWQQKDLWIWQLGLYVGAGEDPAADRV